VQVKVVRRGGLAGVALRGEADTAELGGPQADTAEAELKKLTDKRVTAQVGHPDGFQYEIAFPGDDAGHTSIVLDESQVTPELQPLLDLAMARGRLG
jgi:emfourin